MLMLLRLRKLISSNIQVPCWCVRGISSCKVCIDAPVNGQPVSCSRDGVPRSVILRSKMTHAAAF